MATHSVAGKIPAELVSTDGDITTLQPGETIELKFAVPDQQTPDGWVRKFFFKSHGYYKTFKAADLLPDKFVLGDNYPNPFNPSTTIDLAIPVSTDISLTVINVLGQEVKTIYDGFIEAGNHKMLWEGDNGAGESVASGVYFYRLQSSEFTASKKMILLK